MQKDTILIVEDDPSIARMLEIYLTGRNYHVLIAPRGETALQICRDTPPDLVVLDVRLPDINGYEVGKAIRATPQTQDIPIIVLTAFSERQNKLIALNDVKADYFLGKPFDIEEVYSIIRNQLSERRRKANLHPVTNLPTAELVNTRLRELVMSEGWSLTLVRINGFESFTQFYGTVVGEDVLKFASLLLLDIVRERGEAGDFVGQLVVGPYFVIISAPERSEPIARDLIERFDKDIKLHYDYRDRAKGHPEVRDQQGNVRQYGIMALSVAILSSADGPFRDIRELSEVGERLLQRALFMAGDDVFHSTIIRGRS